MDRHGRLKRNDKQLDSVGGARREAGANAGETSTRRHRYPGVSDALSPQAKGRIERLWGTLQDRLVSELRLAGVRDVYTATEVLERYRPKHNERFAIAPQDSNRAWRGCFPGQSPDEICAFQYIRVVLNNNTVRVGRQIIDIPEQPGRATFARAVVIVRHLLDGGYRVFHEGTLIARAKGPPATEPRPEPHTVAAWKERRSRKRTKGVTESLAC